MTQLQDLMPPQLKAPKVRRVGSLLWGFTLIVMLFSMGGMTGWWARDIRAQKDALMAAEAHLAEIGRLTEAYGRTIGKTATATQDAAALAANAAVTADKASETADKASQRSKVAVEQATKAVTAAKVVPEPTRQQINRSVEEVNRRVQK